MTEGDRDDESTGDRDSVAGGEAAKVREEAPSDPDRAAILARRQRFIALALSGFAGAAGCDRALPQPCLEPPLPPPTSTKVDAGISPHPGPQVCLSPMLPPEHDAGAPSQRDAGPQPCLDVVLPSDHAAPSASASARRPAPRPCLSIKPPKPPPRPCLMVLPNDDADTGKKDD
jgi:hypothetical protein